MRRLRSYISAILISVGLLLSVAFASLWHQTLHTQDSVQYITQDGTAYSMGTGVGSITLCIATRYPELLRDNHVDWLWSAAPGWSIQAFSYGVYTKSIPTTRPSDAARVRTQYIKPAPWNTRKLGFEFGSSSVPLRSGGAGAISRNRFLTLPLWFLMLLTAAPSLLWLRFRFRG